MYRHSARNPDVLLFRTTGGRLLRRYRPSHRPSVLNSWNCDERHMLVVDLRLHRLPRSQV